MYSWLLCCVLGALVSVSLQQDAVRESWSRSMYPNPRTQPSECGRYMRQSYLCDPNHLLSDDEAIQLDLVLEGVRNDTRCPCSNHACRTNPRTGYLIAVALMHHIEEEENYVDSGDSDVQEVIDHDLSKARLFAYTLERSTWNFGECDEDVIILYSKQDNVLYTITGETVERNRKLTAAHIGEISMMVLDKFTSGKVFEGLYTMINEYKKRLMR